ncbi:MAG: helix-turn-helix transcriptional regulator [Rhizobiaceae bacterium]|nr:helix-turn-helix transcriptional regulator [Rhizobiaceae bacterium]
MTIHCYPLEEPVARSATDCPVEEWLAFLGHRWNACLLWHLSTGPKSHGDLATRLRGISSRVLAERLVALEARGIISRTPKATWPRQVIYALTDKGQSLVSIVSMLEPWARGMADQDEP